MTAHVPSATKLTFRSVGVTHGRHCRSSQMLRPREALKLVDVSHGHGEQRLLLLTEVVVGEQSPILQLLELGQLDLEVTGHGRGSSMGAEVTRGRNVKAHSGRGGATPQNSGAGLPGPLGSYCSSGFSDAGRQ